MKIKFKHLLYIGILTILALLFLPNEVKAATWKDTETGITWYYDVSSGNAANVYVNSYTTLPETLVIPDKINDTYPVISIRGYSTNILRSSSNNTVKTVVLPESLQTINTYTFYNFQALTSIVIPDSVTNIDQYAFYNCTSLTSIVLPNSLTNINQYAFYNCTSLPSIVIPNNVTNIGMQAFYNCTSLTELTVPATVSYYTYTSSNSTYRSRAAFAGCSKINKITITPGTTGIMTDLVNYHSSRVYYLPWRTTGTQFDLIIEEGVKEISNYQFSSSSYMKTLDMPDTITKIGDSAFSNCSQIANTDFELPNSLTTIGVNAFYYCSKLTNDNFKLPTSLTTLGKNAFYNCYGLKGEFEIPSQITEILDGTFYNTSFTKVTLPDTVTKIGANAFQRCSKLTEINMGDGIVSIGNYAFESCPSLTGDLKLPDSLTTIGNYAFQNCTGFNGKLTIGASLSSIGSNAFYGCTGFKEAEIKSGITTKVNDSMFANFSNLEKVTLGDSITEIGNYSFQNCRALKNIPLNDNITKIGNGAFYGCKGITTLNLTNNVTTIGDNAFENCTGLTGDMTIPNTVTSLGGSAFYGCSGINGNVTLGTGLTTIKKFTFYGCPNIAKLIIPNNVKTVDKFSLWGLSDAYYLGEEDEVDFSPSAGGGNDIFVHYKNCTHKLTIDVPEGYEIINKETNEVITTNNFNCETALKLAVRMKTGYTMDNELSVVVSRQGKYKNNENIEEKFKISEFSEYNISSLNRDYTISIRDANVITDLVLRNYIYQVNYENLETSRIPNAENESGIISYKHTKVPVKVNTGDLITLKVRVYNEGDKAGIVNEITEYLPEGLVLANSETNKKYGWIEGENGKVSTRYFENKPISAYSGNGRVGYEEISLICKVTSLGIPNANLRLVVIGEISEGGTKDSDSTYGQITSRVDSEYKNGEAYGSTSDSYVRSDDDDTDFENVVIEPSMPVEYTIKVTKIDSETDQLLSGAVFNLKDAQGNIVSTATTDETGVLSFGLITSYGEGTDIYYIEEALAPEGYKLTERETIEVNVTKTIIDETLGTYSLKVLCQTLNYSTDITRYDYNPIATPEHLAKIGSGEWIEYDGFKYQFTETANYRLVNDIDLDGIAWTPINKEIKGIFDGNGHSIKNLTIVSDELYTYSEVGLFRSFSGIVEGLNLENVYISVPGMVIPNEATGVTLDTITGYTCVGGFAGFMERGTVKSCSISGEIQTGCSNVGGFVGHSSENNIIKFQNCTNSAKINAITSPRHNTEYNIGGMIGCAIGSLSLNDCLNEGEITGESGNVGGLVGFVNSTGYEDYSIQAEYSEDDKTIGLVIGNTRATGKYDIILENRDVETLGFIVGAKYSVFDSKLNKISGYEEIQLERGKLRVASVDIDYVGTDTYYIKEQTPAPGYSKLGSYVKLVVSRTWNAEKERFDIEVNADNILDTKIDEEPKEDNTYKPLESTTEEVFAGITEQPIGFFNDKVAIVDCTNKGNITGYMDVAGILGTAYCNVQMNRCSNIGEISATGYGKAGGMIAEVRKQNADTMVDIQNCTNEGSVLSVGSTGSSSGIIAHSYANIKLLNCLNKGEITAGSSSSASGMIADLGGIAEIRECTNEGNLITFTNNSWSDVNCVAGGMVGKNQIQTSYGNLLDKAETSIYIYDCVNTGNVKSACHLGGLVGLTTGTNLVVQNSINKDNEITGVSSDKGGIAGYTSVNNIDIKNCIVKNTKMSHSKAGTYGFTGGIVGNVSAYGNYTTYNKIVNISNCDVLDCIIDSTDKEPAGILGGGHINSSGGSYENSITIKDCNVERCSINNREATSTYAGASGIMAVVYDAGDILISNCNVKDCQINVYMMDGRGGGDTNVGGIAAMYHDTTDLQISDCMVENCDLYNSAPSDGCSNTGGIIAAYKSKNTVKLTNCDVTNCELKNLSGNLGGTVGYAYATTEMKDCNNKGLLLFSTSTTSSNSNTSGMMASSYYPVIMDNCSVEGSDTAKTVIYGRGRNVAGLIAFVLQDGGNYSSPIPTKITNSYVKNVILESEGGNFSSYSTCDIVSGLMGQSGGTVDMENCMVENADIEGIVANATGALGNVSSSSKSLTFKDILIKNTKIKNTMTYDRGNSNSSAAGLLGYINQNSNYINCRVENCDITGSGGVTAGLVACMGNGGNFTDCSVKDTNVTKIPGGNTRRGTTSIGGMIAASNGWSDTSKLNVTGSTVENVKISGDTYSLGGICGYAGVLGELSNNIVKDVTISGTSEINMSSNGSIGGVIGDGASYNGTIASVSNCDVTNLIAESGSNHIGGIFGTVKSEMILQGCDVDNMNIKYKNEIGVQVQGSNYYYRNLGGLIGTVVYIGKTVDGSTVPAYTNIKDCTVKNSNLTADLGVNPNSSIGSFVGWGAPVQLSNCDAINNNLTNNTPIGMAGGAIGSGQSSRNYNSSTSSYVESYVLIPVDDVTVQDCTITAEGAVGGIMGYGVAKVSNSAVNKCTIEDKYVNANGAGGVIGMSLSVADGAITNTSVTDSTIKGKDYAGGILGFTSGKIDQCTVTNTEVTSESTNNGAGGIVGMIYDPSSLISNSTVSGSNITGVHYTGGIAGFAEGDLTNNKVIGDSIIRVTGASNSVGGIVGMATNASSEITNCDTENIEVYGVNGYTGGIAGFANNTISGCDVNHAVIMATGETARGLGGIVGHGSTETGTTTVINSSSIANATLQGKDDVGKVAGAGVADITGCTVDEDTVVITTPLMMMTMSAPNEQEIIEEIIEGSENIEASEDEEIIENSSDLENTKEDSKSEVEEIDNTIKKEENTEIEKDNTTIEEDSKTEEKNTENTTSENIEDTTKQEEALEPKEDEIIEEVEEAPNPEDDNSKKAEETNTEEAIISDEQKVPEETNTIETSSM